MSIASRRESSAARSASDFPPPFVRKTKGIPFLRRYCKVSTAPGMGLDLCSSTPSMLEPRLALFRNATEENPTQSRKQNWARSLWRGQRTTSLRPQSCHCQRTIRVMNAGAKLCCSKGTLTPPSQWTERALAARTGFGTLALSFARVRALAPTRSL